MTRESENESTAGGPGLPARHILHADLDAFYAAVEQLDNPELRGKPVLVGGRPEDRGVVATASYEARRFGVRSAMPMRSAVRLCPQGIIVQPRFDRYREVSDQVMGIFHVLTDLVEPLSLDEAYLDITGLVIEGSPPLRIALDLKRRVNDKTGLTVSVGAATSKSVAKIASDLNKPDGLVLVLPGDEATFLAPLPVGRLWGIGPKTAERLRGEGIESIGQLASQPVEWFTRRFGQRAAAVRAKTLGLDREPVQTERVTKSVSAETTFASDLREPEHLYGELARLAGRVARLLEREELRGRTVTVKLRLADFTTFTRQTTLPTLTQSETAIRDTAWRLLSLELRPSRAFRLLGVGVSSLVEPDEERELQLSLFESDTSGQPAQQRAREAPVFEAI